MNSDETAEASHQLGLSLAQQGKFAEAIEHFQRRFSSVPTPPSIKIISPSP